jgi:hypothetical protein
MIGMLPSEKGLHFSERYDSRSSEEPKDIDLLLDNHQLLDRRSMSTWHKVGISIIGFFVLTVCLGTIGSQSYQIRKLSTVEAVVHTGKEFGDCAASGETVAAARKQGCLFDPMTWAWVRILP